MKRLFSLTLSLSLVLSTPAGAAPAGDMHEKKGIKSGHELGHATGKKKWEVKVEIVEHNKGTSARTAMAQSKSSHTVAVPCLAKGAVTGATALGYKPQPTPQQCFSIRAREFSIGIDEMSHKDYIDNDRDVCDCLKSTYTNGTFPETKKFSDSKKDMQIANLNANIDHKQEVIEEMTDGTIAQAYLVGGDKKEDSQSFVKQYNGKELGKATNQRLEKYREALVNSPGGQKPEIKAEVAIAAKKIKAPDRVRKTDFPSGEIPKSPSNACMSMRTFLGFQSLPQGDEFFQDVAAMSEYQDKDWDLEQLKKDYDKQHRLLANGGPEVQRNVAALGSRIRFLLSNPLFARLFSPRPADDEFQKPAKPFKDKLFNLIKKNFSNKNMADFYKNRKAYDTAVRDIFNSDDVITKTRETLAFDIGQQYDKPEKLLDVNPPKTQNELEERFESWSTKPKRSVSQCNETVTKENVATCTENFQLYCDMMSKVIDEHATNLGTTLDEAPSKALESTVSFDADPTKNGPYLSMTTMFCSMDMRNKKNPADRKSFHDYKKKHCTPDKNGNLPIECGDDNGLLATFLENYEMADESNAKNFGGLQSILAASARSQGDLPPVDNDFSDGVADGAVSIDDIRTYGASRAFSPGFAAEMRAMASIPAASAGTAEPAKFVAPIAPVAASDDLSMASAFTGTSTLSSAALANPAKAMESVKEERSDAEEQLADARDELAKAKAKPGTNTTDIDARIKSLEELLKRKDREYEELSKRLAAKNESEAPAVPGSKKKSSSTGQDEDADEGALSSNGSKSKGPSGGSGGSTSGPGRFIASVPTKTLSAGGGSGGAGSSVGGSAGGAAGGKSSTSNGNLNAALLEKYGIKVDGSTAAKILLSSAQEQAEIPKVVEAGKTQIPVEVSQKQFDLVMKHDLSSLKAIYEAKAKTVKDDVVMISVTTSGKSEPLRFYAIREGGKVVFKPIFRKKTRESLLQNLDV